MVCGYTRQPQIARGGLLWEQIYPQDPDGRPVASPTGAAMSKMNTVVLGYAPCSGCRGPMQHACLRSSGSLVMLIVDELCAYMPLQWRSAVSI